MPSTPFKFSLRWEQATWLTMLSLVLPFYHSAQTLDPVLFPRLTLLGLFTVIVLAFITLRRNESAALQSSGMLRLALFPVCMLYALASALSLTQAINLAESMLGAAKLAVELGFLLVSALLLYKNLTLLSRLAHCVTLSASGLALIGILQFYGVAFRDLPGYADLLPYATMANKNLLASALLLCLPFVLFACLALQKIWRGLGLLALALCTFCIILTGARAVWLGAALATLACGFLAVFRSRTSAHSHDGALLSLKQFAPPLACALLAALLAFTSHSSSYPEHTPLKRLASTVDLEQYTAKERLLLWQKSTAMFADHSSLGVGLNNWKIMLPQYGVAGMRSETGRIHFQQPHNDYVWVLAETGGVGFLAYLSLFALTFFYLIKTLRRTTKREHGLMALVMMFGLIGYATDAFFNFPKERVFHSAYLMVFMAGAMALYRHNVVAPQPSSRALVMSVLAVLLVLACGATLLAGLRTHADAHAKRVVEAHMQNDWAAVIANVDAAESRFVNLDQMATPLAWYRGVANFSLNNIDAAFEDFKRAYVHHPYHLHVLNNLATCYSRRGDETAAIVCYHRALAISPRFDEAVLNLTAIYYNRGEYHAAYDILRQCHPFSENPRRAEYSALLQKELAE